MHDKKCKHKNYFIHTKVRKETTSQIGKVFFFAILCRFNKQKMLVNNKNKLNTIIQIFI